MTKHFQIFFSFTLFFIVSCRTDSNSNLASQARGPVDECSSLVGTCEYYSCIEKNRLSCGETGYPMGYGLNYCEKLSSIEFQPASTALGNRVFPADGNKWKVNVRSCLQVEMEKYFQTNPNSTCQELRTFAFNSHPGCYTQAVNFCELNVQSIVQVGLAIAPRDLVSSESQTQVRETANLCVNHINNRLQSESGFLLRVQLLKYKAIWKTIAASPAGLSDWLGKYMQDGAENI